MKMLIKGNLESTEKAQKKSIPNKIKYLAIINIQFVTFQYFQCLHIDLICMLHLLFFPFSNISRTFSHVDKYFSTT